MVEKTSDSVFEYLATWFWQHVDVKGEDDCWLWKGKKNAKGYGQLNMLARDFTATRVAWEITHGKITPGYLVCHKCDCRACCNPNHLFLGLPKDNTRDMLEKGRESRGSNRHNAKLNEDQVREIRKLFDTGNFKQNELATMFDVGVDVIKHVVNRTTWKWLID